MSGRTRWICLFVRGHGDERASSLGIDPRIPGKLIVTGMLRHAETIAPATQADADALRAWLDTYYPKGGKRELGVNDV